MLWLIRHFAREYPWRSLAVLGCLLVASVFEGVGWSAALPMLNAAVAGEDSGPPGDFERWVLETLAALGIPSEFGPLLAVVMLAFWIKAPISLLAKAQVGYTVAHVATDLRLRLLRSLLAASWSTYTRLPVGLVANSVAVEAQGAAHAYRNVTRALTHVFTALFSIAVATAISWQITAASAAASVVTFGLLQGLVRMAGRAGRRQTRLLRSLLGRLTDVLLSVKLLKATAREDRLQPLLERDTNKLKKALRKRVLATESLRSLQEPILFSFCGFGLLAGRMLELPFSHVLLVIGLFARTLGEVNRIQREVQATRADEAAMRAILQLTGDAERNREEAGGSAPPRLDRTLSLRDVTVSYEERPVLEKVSLAIRAGEITAIVGPSGSGKTTVVDLLTGLVTPDSGAVEVDGTPLAEFDRRAWRRTIGYVTQETLMLNDTIRVNVTLGEPDVSDARIERVLREAEVWEAVSQLPEGIDAPVGERGALLSGGQLQRIAIARALLHEPQLLILDEATAALDPKAEVAIWETVAKLRGRTTVVAVSHQPELVRVADRIYRIEDQAATEVAPA